MAAQQKIVGVKGMNDLLPDQSGLWEWVEARVSEVFRQYGYRAIRTPILEPTALFVRGIGEVTDIVEKEMYTFTDALNGEQLTLRPENTAAVVRSVIEHNLLYDGPKRLWYVGPMFRHERLSVADIGSFISLALRHSECPARISMASSWS